MLNMGGPSNPSDTKDFLQRLFRDPEIITLGGGILQNTFANTMVALRSSKVGQ